MNAHAYIDALAALLKVAPQQHHRRIETLMDEGRRIARFNANEDAWDEVYPEARDAAAYRVSERQKMETR